MPRQMHCLLLLASAAMAALAAGCLQIDTRIRVNEDGSATVTEKLRFSRELLDLEDKVAPDLKLSTLLEKDAALDRAKQMGKGARLASHKVDTVEKGARESVAVYEIPDLGDLRYASPFFGFVDYPENSVIACRFYPLYKSENYVGTAGEMGVAFWPAKPPKGEPRRDPNAPAPKEPSPFDLQTCRELRPLFRDVMRDFKIHLSFESYAALTATGYGHRGHQAGVNWCDLISFSDSDLDNHGARFVENEEIMLDLLRWKPGGKNVVDNTVNHPANLTLPVFLPWGSPNCPWRGGTGIFFRPSEALFKKHFEGKELDYSRWAPSKDKTPARFERIGWKKETSHAESSR